MANVTLQVKSLDANGVTYANPNKPDSTVRIRSAVTSKMLNGVPVQNYATEYIYNDNNAVTVGGIAAVDANSVRVRVSGSLQSAANLRQMLLSMAAQVGTWDTEHVNQGFRPTTAPVLIYP